MKNSINREKLGQFWTKLLAFTKKYRKSSIVILLILILGSYYFYKKSTSASTETRYIISEVTKGTLVDSISGSGQVSALNQIDIKPKVSGDITWINLKQGAVVKAYSALVGINNTDAKRSVLEAEQNLTTSKLQYQKDAAESPIDYKKTEDSLVTAQSDLKNSYNDVFNSLSNTYLDLPGAISASETTLYGYDLSTTRSSWNIDILNNFFNNDENNRQKINILSSKAASDYKIARTKYDQSLINFKQITRDSNPDTIEKILDESIETTTAIAQALQSELNMLGTAEDLADTNNMKLPSAETTLVTNAKSALSSVNSDLSNLLSQKKSLTSAKQNIKNIQDSLTILKVGNPDGSNPISLQISKNNIESQEVKLNQLKEDLKNYTVVAPFDGTIAKVNVKNGDTVSSGTAIATIITNQKIAEISLNEVDIAKVKLGQKATLTFDAVDDLSISGVVSEIDTIGTVSQGVVNYTVKISFDTQDERIKSGMSVNASVITEVKQDVLLVPNSSVKSAGNISYVETLNLPGQYSTSTLPVAGITSETPPSQIQIEVGSSNDTSTEIISGLKEGDLIITRVLNGSTNPTNTTPTILNSFGGTRTQGGGGGNVQIRRF